MQRKDVQNSTLGNKDGLLPVNRRRRGRAREKNTGATGPEAARIHFTQTPQAPERPKNGVCRTFFLRSWSSPQSATGFPRSLNGPTLPGSAA